MCSTLAIPLVLCAVIPIFSATLPGHWHQSNGYGTDTEGGLGGRIYKVTNVNNSGSGSLREAVEASGPRLIVFEVGGVIDLGGNRLVISNDDVTIAGQTAPSPGITLIRGNFTAYANDVVVSHITVQLGDEVEGFPDCVNLSDQGDRNIVFNHVSVYWSKDENLSMNQPINVTLYKCLITEALQYSGHSDGEHSKGSLIVNAENLSLIGTLYAHNAMRNPRSKDGRLVIVNGAVYNWAEGWDHSEEWFNYVVHLRRDELSFAGNVAIQGPESIGEVFVDGHQGGPASAYMDDNIIIDEDGDELTTYNPDEITRLDNPPLWPDGLEASPAHESIYEVLRTAGSRPGDRDRHNARVFKTVADGTGEIIDSQNEVGGYADYPESRRSITVPDGNGARRVWLDSLEDAIAVDKEIDLSRLYTLIGSKESDEFALETHTLVHRSGNTSGITVVQKQSGKKELTAHIVLPTAATVRMTLFDLAGNAVAREPRKQFQAGNYTMVMDVRHLPAGLYLCRFRIGNVMVNRMYRCL